MSRPPRVTVFIPVHNREDYICTAVNSVLAQTYTDFELLVVDDGSTDATRDRLLRYRDPRLRVESSDANFGIPATRNRGLALARGNYIALLDSDDYAYPQRLARQVEWLDEHPDVVQVGSWCGFMDADGRSLRKVRRQPLLADDVHAHMLFHCPVVNRTVMARTAVLRDFGYREAFPRCQDYDLHQRLVRSHRLANMGEILVCGREHEGRFTGRTAELGRDRKMALFREMLTRLEVDCGDEDLARHYHLTRSNPPEPAEEYVRWAEQWLRRLKQANDACPCFPREAFLRVLAAVWCVVCWHARRELGAPRALRLAGSPLIRGLPGNIDPAFLRAALRRPPPPALDRECP
ncbi:MAG: glycosyltransferase family A protein [Gammaproteobacteria bacterium]|nr:glycosyltransferase family A protein [Gammaproteobacteria bacterium]